MKILPIVVLTASKDQTGLIESHRLGVSSCAVKPMSFEGVQPDRARPWVLCGVLLNELPLGDNWLNYMR